MYNFLPVPITNKTAFGSVHSVIESIQEERERNRETDREVERVFGDGKLRKMFHVSFSQKQGAIHLISLTYLDKECFQPGSIEEKVSILSLQNSCWAFICLCQYLRIYYK